MLRSAGSVALTLLGLAFVALWLGGYLPAVRKSVGDYKQERLMAMGFVVERIDVMGEGRLTESEVRAALGIYPGDYFFGADLARAQERTQSLPWVDRAVVRRLWPNRIVVQLIETTPYAMYQEGGTTFLTDSAGTRVAPLTPDTARLPEGLRVFTGPDAAVHAASVTETVSAFPGVWAGTEALTRYPSGRWDLHMSGGVTVRLPADAREGLAKLARIAPQERARFSVIDLRLGDRLTLTPRFDTTT